MFQFVEDKDFLKRAQIFFVKILNELVELLLKEGISSQFILVGSGARNMVTQNNNEPIDLDYNLSIQKCNDINDCRFLKETVHKCLNRVMKNNNLKDVDDSTSVLTTKRIFFGDRSDIKFSLDVCIVFNDNKGNWYRLIHKKTGNKSKDNYYRNMIPNSCKLNKKVKKLKNENLWLKLRQNYLNKKNYYLSKTIIIILHLFVILK